MKTERVPPGRLVARMAPDTIDDEQRTVELVWTTGSRVRRGFFDQYDEELEVSEGAIRWDRLRSGAAPLLSNHDQWSLDDQIGVVEDAWIDGGKGMARVRFANVPSTQEVWDKVRQGVIRNVSVGYLVHKYEQDEGTTPPLRTATDWEPMEISLVTVPADAAAHVRGEADRAIDCVIISKRSGQPDEQRELEMPHGTKAAVLAADDENVRIQAEGERADDDEEDEEATNDDEERGDDGGEDEERAAAKPVKRRRPRKRQVDEKAIEARAQKAERERVADLNGWAERRGVDPSIRDKAINEGWSRQQMAEAHCDWLIENESGNQVRSNINPDFHSDAPVRISAGRQDERQTRRDSMANAILHRAYGERFKLSEPARQFRGLSLLEMARDQLEFEGTKVRGLGRNELARAAFHTTSDFSAILENVLNKSLRAGYDEQPRTFAPWTSSTVLSDFKPASRVLLSETPNLVVTNESGEFRHGSLSESKEAIQLVTYGRIIAVSRQMIVNDDLAAFTRIPQQFGASAARLESDIVYEKLLSNPVLLTDNTNVFHTDHGNLAGSGAAISLTTVQAGRSAMWKQKGLNGSLISVSPTYILVPPDLELTASQLVTQVIPNQSSQVTPEYIQRMQVIVEPRLSEGANGSAGSPTAWYLISNPAQVDTIEYAFLEGQSGLYTETENGFDVDGMRVKARIDFGCAALDFRGMYKNPGA